MERSSYVGGVAGVGVLDVSRDLEGGGERAAATGDAELGAGNVELGDTCGPGANVEG